MAWLESHQTLRDHPKTKKAARLLKVSTPAVVGHLHFLWWWAMDYAQDGDLSPFSPEDIAHAAEWTKDAGVFIDALVGCGLTPERSGFLERDGDSIRIHDWWEYAGRLIEKRRTDAERKRSVRGTSSGRPADIQRTSDGHPAVGERSSSARPAVGARTNTTNTTNTTDQSATADTSFQERYGTLVTACGGSLDQRTCDDFTQIAEDWELPPILTAIRKCREENVRCWPSEVRKRLPVLKAKVLDLPTVEEEAALFRELAL